MILLFEFNLYAFNEKIKKPVRAIDNNVIFLKATAPQDLTYHPCKRRKCSLTPNTSNTVDHPVIQQGIKPWQIGKLEEA